MRRVNGEDAAADKRTPRTLAIDIGGTGLKASILDDRGRMVVKRVRIPTPYPCRPATLLRALEGLVAPLPRFDRVSLGFPGVIRDGRVITAPHFDQKAWQDYPLEQAASRRFGKPARLLNDAEVQGLALIAGDGIEVVLTLGTGVGSAVFSAGWLAPHLELAHHPIHKGKSYNDYIGNAALHALSTKKWNRRVLKAIDIIDSLLHYDVLYIGGGNATNLTAKLLPDNVHIASNDAGITGGIHLWDEAVWRVARSSNRHGTRGARRTAIPRASASPRTVAAAQS